MLIIRHRRSLFLAGIFLFGVSLIGARLFSTPRVLKPAEVPIAFWAWRNKMPGDIDLQPAISETKAKILFLRAGQFDETGGEIKRIAPAAGRYPSGIELHLVYNGTRRLLRSLENIDPEKIGAYLFDTYSEDLRQANGDGANVRGIQLDLDVSERLLPFYAKILAKLRERLPSGSSLSITGLPTWLGTKDVESVLSSVDFWIPQCYGAAIPTDLGERIPISAPGNVAKTVTEARIVGKPFFAGLSAYGYSILYGTDGKLVELRGDIDPAEAASRADLELIETQAFGPDPQVSETRYVYRARSDLVLDGLIIRPGETLVLDLPNSASLRESARAVRETAGESLLGICIFRLPSAGDNTVLSVSEMAAALADKPVKPEVAISLETVTEALIELKAKNTGLANTILGENALTIELSVPGGSIRGVSALAGFTSYETLCSRDERDLPRPCSELRANIIRIKTNSWKPKESASITLSFKDRPPPTLYASTIMQVGNGRLERKSMELSIH